MSKKYSRAFLRYAACFLLALCFLMPSHAERVSDIYQATVPVDNQSPSSRDRGVRRGFEQVLVKVAGNSRALTNPALKSELSKSTDYVTELGYTYIELGDQGRQLALTVRYSQQKINGLFRRESIQIWPAMRAGLLVWLVGDTVEGGKQYMTSARFPAQNSLLNFHMKRRGAPLVIPTHDALDQQLLPAAQAWQFDASRLTSAASRYGVEQWLVIRYYRTSTGQWRGSSFLNYRGKTDLQSFTNVELDSLIAKAVDKAVDQLSSGSAFIPQHRADAFYLTLENVGSFIAYNNAVEYLQSLELVREVQVVSVEADRLNLMLEMDGDSRILLNALRRNRQLTEIKTAESPLSAATEAQQYRFSWQQ